MKNLMFRSARYFAIGLLAFFGVLGTAHAQGGYDRHVVVDNESSYTMVSFHASGVSISSWQEDILGNGVLGSGRLVNINLYDGSNRCHFDFKAVFSNGTEVVRNDVDVCIATKWTIYNTANRLE